MISKQQSVCVGCGYNMLERSLARCPFCGANSTHFLSAEACSARFQVQSISVTDEVVRLNTVPKLGFEHAAYRIATGTKTIWIDCPSVFDPGLAPVDIITVTHRHLLGASNLYRGLRGTQVWIHREDAAHQLARPVSFDRRFTSNFIESGVAVYHIGGHTPGFTVYMFEEVLFVGDLVFFKGDRLQFNPYDGPAYQGGDKLHAVLAGHHCSTVCGANYVTEYRGWKAMFDRLLLDTSRRMAEPHFAESALAA